MRVTLMGIALTLAAAGGLLAVAADQLALPALVNVGLAIVAVGVVVLGLDGVIRRRFDWRMDTWPTGVAEGYAWEVYRGYAAVAWGLGAMAIGALMLVYALSNVAGADLGLRAFLEARPGLIVAAAGAMVAAWGVGMTGYYTVRHRGREYRIWWQFVRRAAGIFTALAGLALCAAGLIGELAPGLAAVLKAAASRWLLALLDRLI